jgi:hypothetical protein
MCFSMFSAPSYVLADLRDPAGLYPPETGQNWLLFRIQTFAATVVAGTFEPLTCSIPLQARGGKDAER